MSEVCWLEESREVEEIFLQFGFSKQQIKKSGLSKKQRSKIIKKGMTLVIPDSLFNLGLINPVYRNSKAFEKPVILEKRESLLALHKPSYCHIHPMGYLEQDNLLSFTREQGESSFLSSFGGVGSYDGGLLYRLDYETSGLVLLTRDSSLYQDMREKKCELSKEYLAVVEGEVSLAEGEYSHYISTSGKVVKEDPQGELSHITIKVLAQRNNQTLLMVELEEGRRHQIRVQLSLLGYPIVGDFLYGAQNNEKFGLHCFRYSIKGYRAFEDRNFWALKVFTVPETL